MFKMYTLKQRNEIARRLAKPEKIDVLRNMLARHNSRMATVILSDRRQLAENLVYSLLEYCTEDEISSALSSGSGRSYVAGTQPEVRPVAIKKKETSVMNILTSAGPRLKTGMSRLRNCFTRTGSTPTDGCVK